MYMHIMQKIYESSMLKSTCIWSGEGMLVLDADGYK